MKNWAIAVLLTPVALLSMLEGVEIGTTPTTTASSASITQQSDVTSPVTVEAAPAVVTSSVPPTAPTSEPVTIVADDQGDLVVEHPDEPYTLYVSLGEITVTTTVVTSVMVSVFGPGVEAIADSPTDHQSVTWTPVDGDCYHWSVVVIVNNDSQVSNQTGTVCA